MLSVHFEADAIDGLVRTHAYWQTLDMPATYPHVQSVINSEIDTAISRLGRLVSELEHASQHWSSSIVVVPDTNVYIEHHTTFNQIDWFQVADQRPDRTIRLVVPLVVIDELDGLKVTLRDEKKRWRVRDALRQFEELFLEHGRGTLPAVGRAESWDGLVTVEPLQDPIEHRRLDVNDAEIVARCAALKRLSGSPVYLVSNDTGILVRARQTGVIPIRLAPIHEEPVEP
jgi:rRNA-processing protein FCF1